MSTTDTQNINEELDKARSEFHKQYQALLNEFVQKADITEMLEIIETSRPKLYALQTRIIIGQFASKLDERLNALKTATEAPPKPIEV